MWSLCLLMVELCLVGDAVGCFESRLSHRVVTVWSLCLLMAELCLVGDAVWCFESRLSHRVVTVC